jgi:D-glycero-alpha-D-manno-heptose-7-phosphate kinase
MKELVPEGKIAMQQQDIKLFGNIISESWIIKKTFEENITNPQVDQKITEILKCGATGAKLLGAGGSGYILAVGEAETLEKICGSFPGTFIKPRVDIEGAEVIYKSE